MADLNANITSLFLVFKVNPGFIAVATPRELQEMDISLLLELPAWLEDECELDILSMTRDGPNATPSEMVPSFLVIQSAGDRAHNQPQPGSPQPGLAGQSGRGASVVSIVFYFLFII